MNTKRNFPGLFEAKLISLHEFHKELPNCGFPDLVVLIESDRTIEMLLPGRENRSSSFPLVIGGKMENKEEQRCIVLCDDLTGTSVQSIQLKARGFSPILKISHEEKGSPDLETLPPIMAVNMNTRSCDPSTAVERVRSVLEWAGPAHRFSKRIDTTLRGHLYDETSVILEYQPDSIALVVPAYPASGRTTIGGYQLLNGTLLERTEVGRDPIWPISTSYLPSYFRGLYSISLLSIEKVKEGVSDIAEELRRMSEVSRVLIADAGSDEDIEKIARAAAAIPVRFIPVDPGPFTSAYFYHLSSTGSRKTAIAIIGSISDITMEQLKYLESKLNVEYCFLGIDQDQDSVMSRFAERSDSQQKEKADVLVMRPSGNFERGREKEIVNKLARLGVRVLDSMGRDGAGVILSGGDTALSFFEHIGACFLEPGTEIAPLMMGGFIKGTRFDGMKVVTKGGLVGGQDGLYRAVRWLRQGGS